MNVFGARLHAARKGKGLTQQALAVAVGASISNVRNWERKGTMPGGENLRELAVVLEVSADYLLGLSDEGGPAPGRDDQDPGGDSGSGSDLRGDPGVPWEGFERRQQDRRTSRRRPE